MDYSDAAAGSVPCRWMRGSLIGSGSFGKVHLAVNLHNGDLFAVKSMHSQGQGQGNPHDFEKEIQILQSLQDCPNVVRCMGRLELEGSKMMCMEYMPGGTLTDFTKRFGGKLEESLVRVYCRGILQGMEYFHRKGIVHCDIKASNVLVGSRGEVKVADFGSAKTITTVSTEGKEMSVKGSPLWMAPEVIREEEQGPASDVWSLGCTLLELLTGRPPWTSSSSSTSNPMSALFRISTSSLSASQLLQHYYSSSSSSGHDSLELSEEGKDFLLRCLKMDPKARWSASELLMHPFLCNTTHFSYKKEKEVLPSSPISTLDFHAQYWENSHTSTSSSCSTFLPSSQYSNSLDTPSDHSMGRTTTDDNLIRQHRFSLNDAQDTTSSSSASSQNLAHPPNRIESMAAEEDEDCSSSSISSSGMLIGDKQQWIVVHESAFSSPSSISTPPLKPFCFDDEGRGRGRGRGRGEELKKCDVGLDLDSFGFFIKKRRREG